MLTGPGAFDLLDPDERDRVDVAESLAYEALYAAAAPQLGTGSERIGDCTLIWHPSEEEAGYNCLVNFHRADDLDATLLLGRERLRSKGSRVFGLPVDERIAAWGTPARLTELGLDYQSDEVIWGRTISQRDELRAPTWPTGVNVGPADLPREQLTLLINEGWGLEADDPRGVLYSFAPGLPDWKVYVAKSGTEVAGVSVFCSYEGVGLLMLAVVLPGFRGCGMQSAFIDERLREAQLRGCTLAISETNDDNSSPRNLQRAGFQHWITRRIYSGSM